MLVISSYGVGDWALCFHSRRLTPSQVLGWHTSARRRELLLPPSHDVVYLLTSPRATYVGWI